MATKRSKVRKVDSNCNFCDEIMPKPKSLECLHNFCTRCIQQLQKISEPGSKIKCPVCNESSDIPFKAKEILKIAEPISSPGPVVPQSATVIDKANVTHATRISQHDLRNIETFLKNKVKSIYREHAFGRFVNHKNSLWAARNYGNCLDVYSYDLTFLMSMACPGIDNPRTLHPLTSQLMLVGGDNGLFVMDTGSGLVNYNIIQGGIQDVHVNQGLIAVVVHVYIDKHRYVQVLQKSPIYTTVFTVEHPDAFTVLVTPDKMLLVSDWNNRITQYNKYGDKITLYSGHVSGSPRKLYYLQLCLTDAEGNILVADCWNHRLKVFTKDGEWIVPQQQRKIFDYPTDISVTETHLYVKDNKRIHMFALPSDSK